MTKVLSQPMKDEPTPQEWQAWADEAQACVDSGEVVISDHRKAQATIAALREHAALKARITELEKHLKSVSNQCGNVIYNCEQRPADNERHLSSWRGVKEYAEAALNPRTGS